MSLDLKNVLGFKELHLDFSYPKKLRKNTIGEEWLKEIPTFRYKKVNVIMGSNSNGKSSLGRTIWSICLFLRNKESSKITRLISDGSKEMIIKIDYVSHTGGKQYVLNRVAIMVTKKEKNEDAFSIKMHYSYVTLRTGDTYESACENLVVKAIDMDYLECLNIISHSDGWFIAMPITESGFNIFSTDLKKNERAQFSKVLFNVLKALDPNIESVSVSREIDNAYIVKYDDGKNTIVKKGDKISDIPFLSSGTKYGFIIADVIYALGNHNNGLFFIDELFSYIDSDLEIAMLNLMISLLDDCEQLFFTTHNSEVLLLPFPLHTFTFLGKKTENGEQAIINSVCASDVEKRNNVVVKNLYDNDYFDISPDISKIFEIEELFKHDKN